MKIDPEEMSAFLRLLLERKPFYRFVFEFQSTNGDKKPEKNGTSNRGRKRFVPLALKTCGICSMEFADHAGNLAHWKDVHPR